VPLDADSPAPVAGRGGPRPDADRAEEAGVSVRGLVKSYGAVRALAGVDLEAAPGTVLGLLGPNGAGKTTIIRILTTLLTPDAGTARVAGLDVVRDAARLRERIGLAGQYAAVDENLTGLENLTMVGRLYGEPRAKAKQRGRELLERFELLEAAGRPTKTYSGGMRRRLDLAAALVANPPVLFLDEPTTGLDPRSRLELWETIERLVAEGTTVLLTTQNLDEADRLASNIAVIDHGRLLAEGTPDELKDQVGGQRLEIRLDDAGGAQQAVRALASVTDDAPDVAGDLVTVGVRGSRGSIVAAVRALDHESIAIADIALRRPTLDDVFLALTGHAAEVAEDASEASG
jgi:ABC-2 type transport system ATP-binding protein